MIDVTRVIDLDKEKPALEEAIEMMSGGDEISVLRGGAEIARLTQVNLTRAHRKPLLGSHPGWVTYIADDFDAELLDSFWLGEE